MDLAFIKQIISIYMYELAIMQYGSDKHFLQSSVFWEMGLRVRAKGCIQNMSPFPLSPLTKPY